MSTNQRTPCRHQRDLELEATERREEGRGLGRRGGEPDTARRLLRRGYHRPPSLGFEATRLRHGGGHCQRSSGRRGLMHGVGARRLPLRRNGDGDHGRYVD